MNVINEFSYYFIFFTDLKRTVEEVETILKRDLFGGT